MGGRHRTASSRRSSSVPAGKRFRLAEGDAKSVIADDIVSGEKKGVSSRIDPRDLSACDSIHTQLRPSLLSIDASAGQQNFRGFYTLAGLILFVMNARLVVENILQYGILIFPNQDVLRRAWSDRWPCTTMAAFFPCFAIAAYIIELASYNNVFGKYTATLANAVVISTSVMIPGAVPGIGLLGIAVILALKLCSYAHVRLVYKMSDDSLEDVHQLTQAKARVLDQRQGSSSGKANNTRYHSPPRFLHFCYFMAAPTLCYQEVYPRSNKIRAGFIARRLCEIVFILTLIFVLVHQYIMPILEHTFVHIDNRDLPRIVERVLKLAIPNTLVWILGFYLLFHSMLNLTAEILRFGDRLFYMDWWNAPSLGIYWRTWNLPVRHFMLRHVYAPALRIGAPPVLGQLFAFLLSAIVHELFFSVPCHMIQPWTFLAMLFQVPLIYVTGKIYKRFKQPIWGNVVFWVVFCILGQPLLMITYGYAYVRKYKP